MRPKKTKQIGYLPKINYFKPEKIRIKDLEINYLTFEELESLRLKYLERIDQINAAQKMNIHQSTFQRTLTKALEKVSDALVNGKAIKIQGGVFDMPNLDGTGPEGKGKMAGRGQGRCNTENQNENQPRPRRGMKRRKGQRFNRN